MLFYSAKKLYRQKTGNPKMADQKRARKKESEKERGKERERERQTDRQRQPRLALRFGAVRPSKSEIQTLT